METKYRISVVIPTYNRKEKVLNAIGSVLEQTVSPIEILIIDDGSTDGTHEMLSLRTDIRYIWKENGGVSSARNMGVKEAKGNWVAFLDSDDEWLPSKLEEQISCIDATGMKANYTSIAEDGKAPAGGFSEVKPDYHQVFFSDSNAYDFLWKTEKHPMVQTLLIEKNFIRELGSFDQSLSVAEDTAFFYKIVLSGQFSYTNKILASLNRIRDDFGLNDDPCPEKALERFRCYVRVQSELFWRLLPKNLSASRHVLGRLGHFSGKCAELECAFGKVNECRYLALCGVLLSKSLKGKIKSLALLLSPGLFRKRFARKWGVSLVSNV